MSQQQQPGLQQDPQGDMNRNQDIQGLSRQLEYLSLAQNQQNQNGPINLANRVGQPQGGSNVRPPMSMLPPPPPGMNSSGAMRSLSLGHPMPPSQSQTQPSDQSGMPMRSRTEIQERVQQLQVSITQVDAAMHQLQSRRNQHPADEAVLSGRMRQLQMEKATRTDTISRLQAVLSSMDNNVNMPSNLNSGSQTNPWQNSTMQASFGQGASQPPNNLSSQNNPTHPHQPPHVPNSLAPNNVPPRSGPTPNSPFHTSMENPTFPFNPDSQQNPASGSGPSSNLPNPNGGPSVPMMTFNIPPLDKSRFEGAFKAWCHQKSISIDQRLLDIDGRPIDLHSLHSYVIQEGGLANMQSKDLWAVIGGRMGFVQFPGGPPNDLPKSGPAIAQQLAHVYKEYLAAFDTVYNGFQHSSRDPEQYDQQTSGNDQGTEDAYDRNTDGQTAAEDPPSNPTNTEHSGGISRGVGGITGRYTEQDNRRIHRNVENVESYREDYTLAVNNNIQGDWKTFIAGGGVATTAFYTGHTTAVVQGPSIPTNHAIAIIYPQWSFDQAPSLVVSFVILPVVLVNLFWLVRQCLVAGVI